MGLFLKKSFSFFTLEDKVKMRTSKIYVQIL